MSSSLPAEEAAPTSRRTLSLHLDISGDLSADDRQAELAQRLAATALGGGHQLTVVRETGDSSTADVASSSSPTAAAHSAAVDASFDSASAAAAPVIATKTIDLLSTRVVKEGGLCKLGAKVKSWKNRYFKLVGFVLSYYESAESQQTVLGEINLIGTLVKPEPKEMFGLEHTFSITQTQAGQRTYYIVAPSAEDLAEWIFLLKQRHSFAPQGLPLRLNPRVHINMNLNPDDDALRAIAVNSQPINSSYISTDADRKENSKSTLKGAVSKKKRRFVMDGFDLDLTYITNRIIAMGFPADGTEAMYRNDMVDVQRFFDTRHADHYKVYNLCSERKYDHTKFHHRVLEFPFDDHNCCYMEDLPVFCKDLADFLSADEKNVAVVHCKAGKGRTGLLIVIFLLYCGEWQTASEALRYYAFARTQNQKGVTIASQIRWVHYWEKYLSLSRDGIGLPKLEPLSLRRMVFSKKSPSYDYFVTSCHGEVISSKDVKLKETKTKDGGYEIEFPPGANGDDAIFTFLKDFQIEFFDKKLFGGSSRIMSFWLHTQFLAMEPDYYLKLERSDIDKVSKSKSVPDFTLELYFEPATQGRKATEAAGPSNALSSGALTINPMMPTISPNMSPDYAEMIQAGLTMMIEGRKMTRFYAGNKELKEKEVEKRDIFLFLKEDNAAAATASTDANNAATAAITTPSKRNYTLHWCLDRQSISNVSSSTTGYEKLRVSDIQSVQIGKQADLWSRGISTKQAIEDRCLSIIARDPTPAGRKAGKVIELHIEAYSERQLSLWVEGLKFLLSQPGQRGFQEAEGEAFQQSLLALTADSPTSANGPDGAVRGRAESFARPPPIKVPTNRHRRVISVTKEEDEGQE